MPRAVGPRRALRNRDAVRRHILATLEPLHRFRRVVRAFRHGKQRVIEVRVLVVAPAGVARLTRHHEIIRRFGRAAGVPVIVGSSHTAAASAEIDHLTAIAARVAVTEAGRDHEIRAGVVAVPRALELHLLTRPHVEEFRILHELPPVARTALRVHRDRFEVPGERRDLEQPLRGRRGAGDVDRGRPRDHVVREVLSGDRRAQRHESEHFHFRALVRGGMLPHLRHDRIRCRGITYAEPWHYRSPRLTRVPLLFTLSPVPDCVSRFLAHAARRSRRAPGGSLTYPGGKRAPPAPGVSCPHLRRARRAPAPSPMSP